jgi:hypothetical protein
MTCEELRDDYTVYALGIAQDPAGGEITEHLARKCPVCVPGVAAALASVSAMSGAVKVVEPPKSLRRRIMSMLGRPEKRSLSALLPWAVAAVCAITLLAVSMRTVQPDRDTAVLQEAISILKDPLTKDITFGDAKPAQGRIFASPGKGVVFIAANLPALDAGRVFELWVIPTDGKPIPAGTFRSRPDATAVYVRPGKLEPNASAFAVTVEPEGGSAAPTTKPFIVAPLA